MARDQDRSASRGRANAHQDINANAVQIRARAYAVSKGTPLVRQKHIGDGQRRQATVHDARKPR
jgi:hypothetical protein